MTKPTPEEIIDQATKGNRIYWSGQGVVEALVDGGYEINQANAVEDMRERSAQVVESTRIRFGSPEDRKKLAKAIRAMQP